MKRFLLVLSIMMLVLCLGVCLVACGGNENPPAGTGTGTGTGGTNSGNTDTNITYTVTVVDQFGNPIEGVNLQVCYGDEALGNCLRPGNTDANGIKTYSAKEALVNPRVQINSAPQGAEIPEDYIYFAQGETEVTVTLNVYDVYTFTAKNEDGTKVYVGVEFMFYAASNLDEMVSCVTTDENGNATASVTPGEYIITVKHPNGAFTLTNGTNGNKVSNLAGNSFDAIFSESNEEIQYTVNVNDTSDNGVEGAVVTFYGEDFEYVGQSTADASGVASVQLVNGNYYAVVSVENKSASAVIFEKDRASVGSSTVTNQAPGTFKSNAIIVVSQLDATIEAGQSVWFYLPNADGYKLVFDTTEGFTVASSDGAYAEGTLTFETENQNGFFKITNEGSAPLTVAATREAK
ncbi:MAG: hypothetical protein IJ309_01830 [Clostridia bacterium]|nr:hypothetical protein [Clostridia bacterium]